MTQNQISYWKLQEDIRAHKAEEAENYRSHRANEYIGFGTMAETMRHNIAGEKLTAINYGEAARHNAAMEEETYRSDLAGEALKHEANMYNREVGLTSASVQRQVGLANVAESTRHNSAMEGLQLSKQSEDARHNVATESYSYYRTASDVDVRSKANELREQELELSKSALEETKRHNEAQELTDRFTGVGNTVSRSLETAMKVAPYFVIPQ